MSRRAQRIAALGLVGGAVLLAVLALTTSGSVRSFIAEKYRSAGNRGGERLYTSPRTATQTARDIREAHAPSDERITASGVFLRYRDDYVRVSPAASGSTVGIIDEDRGYGAYYGVVGGYWGRYSGRGEGFRGGGPGAGK